MAQTTFSVRMDSEVKRDLDKFCADVGLNTTTAINLFAHTVIREQRLPFEITTREDPFYSEANQKFLRESIAQLERGEGTVFDDVSEVLTSRS
jgi:DNA-damage-inducible protein J